MGADVIVIDVFVATWLPVIVPEPASGELAVGAIEVPHRDPMLPKQREVSVSADRDAMVQLPAVREATHRAAVERLCHANGWEGATIERAGEKWSP